jgi:hypothetical protein
VKDGSSLEAFDASLPGEWRAVLPPLHTFIANFDRPKTDGEPAADAILSAARTARGETAQ